MGPSGGQGDFGPTDGAEIRSSGVNYPACAEMRSARVDNPAIDDPESDNPGTDTPGAENEHTLKLGYFLLNVVM